MGRVWLPGVVPVSGWVVPASALHELQPLVLGWLAAARLASCLSRVLLAQLLRRRGMVVDGWHLRLLTLFFMVAK